MCVYITPLRLSFVYVQGVTAGTDIAVTAISAPADVPLPDGVRPCSSQRASTDWMPARNVRAPDTYRLSRVVEPSTNG